MTYDREKHLSYAAKFKEGLAKKAEHPELWDLDDEVQNALRWFREHFELALARGDNFTEYEVDANEGPALEIAGLVAQALRAEGILVKVKVEGRTGYYYPCALVYQMTLAPLEEEPP